MATNAAQFSEDVVPKDLHRPKDPHVEFSEAKAWPCCQRAVLHSTWCTCAGRGSDFILSPIQTRTKLTYGVRTTGNTFGIHFHKACAGLESRQAMLNNRNKIGKLQMVYFQIARTNV